MPSRSAIKEYAPESFYHIYARGASKQIIFQEDADFQRFESLFARYLSSKESISSTGQPYPNYFTSIELMAYCLMGTHFHMLIWQQDADTLKRFMQSLMTSYAKYFNIRYKRSGAVFESRYKGSRIEQDAYLMHISRYIHLNPRYWQRYHYSSYRFYYTVNCPEWLQTGKVAGLFDGKTEYSSFHADYTDHKKMLDEIKHELADQ